jgi:hypothetical protein
MADSYVLRTFYFELFKENANVWEKTAELEMIHASTPNARISHVAIEEFKANARRLNRKIRNVTVDFKTMKRKH